MARGKRDAAGRTGRGSTMLLSYLLAVTLSTSPAVAAATVAGGHFDDVCDARTCDARAGCLGRDNPRARSGSATCKGESCCVPTMGSDDPNMNNCGGTRPVGLPFATRSPIYARNGMAASSQPLTTQVALDILKLGGNAVDAAIAANAMEGVVEPMMNGIGGDLMAIVYDAKTKKLVGLNSSGRSSKSTTLAEMRAKVEDLNVTYIPNKGPLPVSVPGAVMGWCMLHEKFGQLQWEKLFEPAIRYAREGFPVSPVIASEWEITDPTDESVTSNGKYPKAANGFLHTFALKDNKGYRAPRTGEIFRNPDLARSYEIIQSQGCDGFYKGEIAKKIADFSTVAGTLITEEDLNDHKSEWVELVNTTYRDVYRVFELPPNPQGLAALQQLNILEGFNLTEMGHNTADYLHVHIEAKKLAFADRAKYYADPDFVRIPVEGLLSKTYAAERRKLIDMSKAMEYVQAGVPSGHESDKWSAQYQDLRGGQADTMYLTTADASGNMVSLIQSNYNGFGSGLVVPGLGFALQDRGALFSLDPTANDVFAPGKRPFHTIMPGFVTRNDKPWLSFGVMGGNMQPQGQVQILTNIIDFGMNVQEAGDAARYYHTGSSQPTGQVMTDGGLIVLEAGICPSTRVELADRGHSLAKGFNAGGYQGIMVV
eukprot:CAMPEP_0114530366 /NCGR_PEP_ID=MMETSP0109-20121206/25405_1 /TAXON_ID=29199 /ORGANISM="Chlorarachnion reptans, Strain CCCM449" /LENGTH=652 /DNA_ID=CAMNT_0001712981 /DNA_START=35 /DNA_END=1990 /DNA_ORIENTATION=-